jgi:phosphatidylglycerol---prolipoprotein diacylglyceryl transferase
MAYYVHDLSPFLWQWSENWGLRYYGLAYLMGFIGAWIGLQIFQRKGWSQLKPGEESDLLTWLVLGVLLGGRLGYVLFYEDWRRTLHDPLGVIAFWREGGISGMASHGGFAGVILAIYLFSRYRKISFWSLADNIAVLTPLGLFWGRVANFINGELWGRPSTLPWAVIFPQDPMSLPRHPSQLYEALGEGLLLFFLMLYLRSKHWAVGRISLLFLGLYALARTGCEFFREPDGGVYYFDFFTKGQLLSFVLLIFAGAMWFVLPRADVKK